ncbi:serine hydrolase [Streptomyces sp. NPDC057433]|uniref:serine hydrolase n=1 Tax=Streptomyces sp. NPDC057433 TaxID=3346132 RepID=UPI0036C0B2EA
MGSDGWSAWPAAVAVPDGAEVSVGVLDPVSGAGFRHGGRAFVTASVVKVGILAALLLKAQDAGRALSGEEHSYAAAMIERSDNDAASVLWRSIGRAGGLDAAHTRLGLTGTEGGDGPRWGLTRTTAADQLLLLRQVFGNPADSALTAASRAYVRGLMERVVPEQAWGVPVVADALPAGGAAWAVKNGWVPRDATGLWAVNSVGRVTVGGRELLVAALSDGNPTMARGVALVEAAARAAVSAVRPHPPGPVRPGRGDAAGRLRPGPPDGERP